MAADQGLIDWVSEAMEPVGRVTRRAMMGGATLYVDGGMTLYPGFETGG